MRTESTHSPVGLTRYAGWELDVRRTVPVGAPELWRRLLDDWLPQWLEVDSVPQMVGAPLRITDRVRGRVVGCHVGRRVRLDWTPPDLDHETMFEVTLLEDTSATVILLHQERLLDAAERQRLLDHWTAVLSELRI